MATKELIKQVAAEFKWEQINIRRAIAASQGEVTTREEIILCMLRFAGPELEKRNDERAAQKRVNTRQKNIIKGLIGQLTDVQEFYAAQLVPALRATINDQAVYIADLLRQVSGKSQGGKNG